MSNKKKRLLPGDLKRIYGFTDELIKKYLGAPDAYCRVNGRIVPVQTLSKVEAVVATEEFQRDRALAGTERVTASEQTKKKKRKKKHKKKKKKAMNSKEFLEQFDISGEIEKARGLERKFILHCGPTNSGKTYNAVNELKKAETGAYLGPLRLLALEIFDKLNTDGKPCSLLTGEEFIDIPCSKITASTIEMCDYSKHYDVVVIDEAQLISSIDRGGHWLNAILKVDASFIHICTAPEALNAIKSLLESFDASFETVFYNRLTPLVYAGEFAMNQYYDAKPGDAFIVFSRKAVLGVASELERCGIKASVIYGALPPQSRREEVQKLVSGETNVVVATDAIGMGVSLPIKRIIFCQTQKFDGTAYRILTSSEIKQIAGRAGRFGIYDTGEVLTMERGDHIREAIEGDAEEVRSVVVPFPKAAVDGPYGLKNILTSWQRLEQSEGFVREDMTEALTLYRALKRTLGEDILKFSPSELLEYITCPVDTNCGELIGYWVDLTVAILLKLPVLPEPKIFTDTLDDCEISYKALDIEQQMLRRIGQSKDTRKKKELVEKQIKLLLDKDKTDMQRKCEICSKPLSPLSRYRICDECFKKNYRYGRN